MEISWNNEKNEAKQKQFPGLSFELIANEILAGRYEVQSKKNNEDFFIVYLPWEKSEKYPIQVAFVIDKDLSENGKKRIFLKTFYPNRNLK